MSNSFHVLQKKTSTRIPKGARIIRSKKAVITINGVRVAILPDSTGRVKKGSSAQTSFEYGTSGAKIDGRGFVTPPTISLKIFTIYKKKNIGRSTSAYGRGTTAVDRRKKNTSLQFHEAQHGADYLRYLRTHRPPKFGGGKKKMTVEEFYEADEKFQTDIANYFNRMDKYSLANTDCVGVTIDKHHHTNICSPH